jgi:tellurite resistance protein
VIGITNLMELAMARNVLVRVRWLGIALLVPCAMAQTPEADERRREQWRQQEEQHRRAQEDFQRQQQKSAEEEKQRAESSARSRKEVEQWEKEDAPRRQARAEQAARQAADAAALRKQLMPLPPLPSERNVLLGNWRLEGGGQQNKVLAFGLTGKGATPGFGEMMGFMKSLESGQLACDVSFGHGISFTPTTYSSGGVAGMAGGPVSYRSPNKQFIVAIPADSRAAPMPFEIAGPNRIVWGGQCALVRAGSPAANPASRAPALARDGSALAPAAPGDRATADVVADGAAFRCADGSLLHVSFCRGNADDATCKLTELHKPGLQIGTMTRRADIAARVKSCEAGGIRYGADDKPVFVR